MPIFDYECKECGYTITDVIQKRSEADLIYCPECNEPQLGKKLSTYDWWFTKHDEADSVE